MTKLSERLRDHYASSLALPRDVRIAADLLDECERALEKTLGRWDLYCGEDLTFAGSHDKEAIQLIKDTLAKLREQEKADEANAEN